ncbi:MAG: alanine--tRNA ligase, partial [Candidatus Eiseniibacteriota bacterium]
FRALLARIERIVGRRYAADGSEESVSMRVIADHARATAFLLADDVNPDKTGRGYVLRKIMRRAVSHGVLLGMDRPFLAEVVAAVSQTMGDAHPLLLERATAVHRAAEAEETLFLRTVEEGMRRIDDLLRQIEDPRVWSGSGAVRTLRGDVAFRLYDTYGCPLELTASVGVRRGFSVDEAGYFAAMEAQRARSRASWKGGGEKGAADAFLAPRRAELGATRFTGYDTLEGESEVIAVAVAGENGLAAAERAAEGAAVAVVMRASPFYGEAGGQVGDTGEIETPGGRVRVEDTQKAAGGEILVHFGVVEQGELGSGQSVRQRVDATRRGEIAAHHSATHLVHHALREVLGKHVGQKGSLVAPEHLRFDFSHGEALRPDEMAAVEDRVAELALADHRVTAEELPYRQAVEKGALAFFGDKYGDVVRMVTMGPSRELCGGTHVRATGELGLVTLVSESSVAAGVRRVTALAGTASLRSVRALRAELAAVARVLRATPEDSSRKIEELQNDLKRLRRRVEELEGVLAGGAADSLAASAKQVAGHRVIAGRAPVETRDALRDLGDKLRGSGPATVVVLGAEMEGKVALVAAVSDDVVKAGRLKAGDLVGKVAALAGGGGGGKPHLATAGAKDPAKLADALEAVPRMVAELLS